MAWINMVAVNEARGLLAAIFKGALARAGKVFHILRIQSVNPPVVRAGISLYREIMFGESPLSRAQREMIAVVVSRANDCHY